MLQNYWRGQHKLQKVGLIMKVENLTNARGNKVANQFIITDAGRIQFQSYESLVCSLERDGNNNHIIIFDHDWNYSPTTSKHLYTFLEEQLPMDKPCKKDIERWIKNGICDTMYTNYTNVVKYDENMRQCTRYKTFRGIGID